jgi:hypothetical protein
VSAGVERVNDTRSKQLHPEMRTVAPSARRISIIEAIANVMSNADLVTHILSGTIGPTTLVAASRVCKLWHSVCRSDETVVRLAALYQGGVIKTIFCGLFALTPLEAATLAHTVHHHRSGRLYYVYRDAAVADVLGRGGMAALRDRLIKHGTAIAHGAAAHDALPLASAHRTMAQRAKFEDLMHGRHVKCATVC